MPFALYEINTLRNKPSSSIPWNAILLSQTHGDKYFVDLLFKAYMHIKKIHVLIVMTMLISNTYSIITLAVLYTWTNMHKTYTKTNPNFEAKEKTKLWNRKYKKWMLKSNIKIGMKPPMTWWMCPYMDEHDL